METKIKQKNKETRAAIYIRVSTDEQGEKYGPKVQKEMLLAFCKSQIGYSLDENRHIYEDIGYSGSLPVEERPAMNRMFENASKGEFDVVLVFRFDRFFRNAKFLLGAIDTLGSYNVAFRSTTEPFDTSDPIFGRLITTILGAISESERETIKLRMQSGRRRAVKDGKWMWGPPPYGYRLDHEKKKLVVYENEAKWVRTFFKWLVDEKLPLGAIHKRANELNVPCYQLRKRREPKNKNYWHRSTIARILCNPIYTGTDHFYRYKNGKKRLTVLLDQGQQNDESQWITFTAKAIITPEQFALGKKQLLKNREMGKRNLQNIYLFNKILYCGKCGLKLFAGNKPPRGNRNMFRFYHGGREPKWKKERIVNNNRCHSCGDIGEARLLSVWDTLKELLERPEYMMDKLRNYDVVIPSDEAKEQLKEAEERLKALAKRKKRIDQIYESSNTMDYEQYQKKLSDCAREEERLKDDIVLLNQKLLRKNEIKDSAEHLKKLYGKLKTYIINADYEAKSEIVHMLVDKITLYKEEEIAEVRMKVPVDMPEPLTIQDVLGNQGMDTNVLCPQRSDGVDSTGGIGLCPQRIY